MGPEISIADLSAACEIAQLSAIKHIIHDISTFNKIYPITYAWLDRLMAIPDVQQVHFMAIP